ncbi:unnamed protein product [Paramecium octaurelia]|uniref:Uncharacterized protein n=1 Tax=Paramecium octaurelia TaxID=43137 RepID=A0A8S1SPI2_PAROT|nr:unnamed protein product [Paramecium octaurelia]
MLPQNLLGLQIADKILFIGKAVKVLKRQQQLFINEHQSLIKEIEVYDSQPLTELLSNCRNSQLIVDKQELFIHLINFYLLILLNTGNFIKQFLSDLHKMDYDQNRENGIVLFLIMVLNMGHSNLQIIYRLKIIMGPARGPEDWSGVFRDVKQSIENGFTLQTIFILQVPQDLDEENDEFIRLKLEEQKVSSISAETRIQILRRNYLKLEIGSEGDLHNLKQIIKMMNYI